MSQASLNITYTRELTPCKARGCLCVQDGRRSCRMCATHGGCCPHSRWLADCTGLTRYNSNLCHHAMSAICMKKCVVYRRRFTRNAGHTQFLWPWWRSLLFQHHFIPWNVISDTLLYKYSTILGSPIAGLLADMCKIGASNLELLQLHPILYQSEMVFKCIWTAFSFLFGSVCLYSIVI